MKTVVLLYDSSCIYEIVILNYFLKVTGRDVVFASPDGNAITAMEGYSINTAGVLNTINPTHSTDLDVAVCDNIITVRANGYVDFAIETAKKLNLFEDEADLQETIAFWREFQRVE